MVHKISQKSQVKNLNEINHEYLEEKGYFKFGNYMITQIVHDYLYLVEDFLLQIEEKTRLIPNWVLVLYLKVMEWNLDRKLQKKDLQKYCEFLEIKSGGDRLMFTFNNENSISILFIIIINI